MLCIVCVFFFKQKTAYEMRISDWSSDVCSSDLPARPARAGRRRMTLAGEIRCDTVAGDVTRHRNRAVAPSAAVELSVLVPFYGADPSTLQIGRASCRERVCQYG